VSTEPGIVVVGGGVAAVECALALRDAGWDGGIRLISAEPDPPYDRTLLSKDVLVVDSPSDADIALELPDRYAELDIQLSLGVEVRGADVYARELWLDSGERARYRTLVAATGATPVVPAGLAAPGVLALRDLADARRLARVLSETESLTVIGGGFIGCEVAAAATARGVTVTIVEAAPVLLSHALGPVGGDWIGALHERNDVELRLGSEVARLDASASGATVELRSGETIDSDALVVAVGVRPCADWLLPPGVPLRTDVYGRTRLPGVWAAGDCSEWEDPVLRRFVGGGHWDSAARRARLVGNAIAGRRAQEPFVPFFWSDQHGVKLQVVGWPQLADSVDVKAADDESLVIEHRRAGRLVALSAANVPGAVADARGELRTMLERSEAGWVPA
jgi:3-phenylpropionate/trans-cinnamate dioxygenase ferredoxin reductase component